MNETVFGLLSALTIYALASLALPQRTTETTLDASDLASDVETDARIDTEVSESADITDTDSRLS